MKRISVSILFSLFLTTAFAQALNDSAPSSGQLVERTFLTTDRDNYLAGDEMWCSLWCVDLSNGCALSDFSSVAYVEVHSSESMVATGKIGLSGGRGAGSITLPGNLPTGNYRLIAYTAQNKNEADYEYDAPYSRTVSVFNPFIKERVKDGTQIVDAEKYTELLENAPRNASRGALTLVVPMRAARGERVPVTLNGAEDATLSISIWHDDGMLSAANGTIADFMESLRNEGDVRFNYVTTPEYEGEIIAGRVVGHDPSSHVLNGKFAFISAPGNKSDVYSSDVDADGMVHFYTNNIYGNKELVCEIEGLDSTMACHIELISPFVNATVKEIPALPLCSALSERLKARSAALQIEKRFASDTLYERLQVRDNLLFGREGITYRLDDYTRFPLMEEVIVEYVQPLRARRKGDGSRDIQVRIEDSYRNHYFTSGMSLMMLDGIPIFDHEKIYRYDPLLVETINIYPNTYYIGRRQYEGIVNFVTYKRNLPSMQFNNNVRILNFQGISYPRAYTCSSLRLKGDYPDYRQTIYWHPLVDLEGGKAMTLECATPQYGGTFIVVVEGVTASGEPVYERKSFEVR